MTLIAGTTLFGDVAVRAHGDAHGHVKALEVTVNGEAITVPAAWMRTLPTMWLGSLEVRTERGRDRQPWPYLVFRQTVSGRDTVHIAIAGSRVARAFIQTHDLEAGTSTFEERAGP